MTIPEKQLAYAYTAGQHARERGAPLSACPVYAINAQGAPWREQWKRGWLDANRALGAPDPTEPAPLSAPTQAIRPGRRSKR